MCIIIHRFHHHLHRPSPFSSPSLNQAQASASGLFAEVPDKEFVVCALDLLSGISDGIEGNVSNLVMNSNVFVLLYTCVQDIDADVRQSAIALVGDLAKNAPSQLAAHLDKFLEALAKNLDPRWLAVCNNASWAIGEIALKFGQEVGQKVPAILASIVPFTHYLSLL